MTFVGRREPLALIRRTLAAGAGCVLVEGPAGIGKSRLLTEAARAHHVFTGFADSTSLIAKSS